MYNTYINCIIQSGDGGKTWYFNRIIEAYRTTDAYFVNPLTGEKIEFENMHLPQPKEFFCERENVNPNIMDGKRLRAIKDKSPVWKYDPEIEAELKQNDKLKNPKD